MTSQARSSTEWPLDVQSRGRPLTEAEAQFADALETLFAESCHDFTQVAAGLTRLGISSPGNGSTSWSVDSLFEELHAINAKLDAAFDEDGYGA